MLIINLDHLPGVKCVCLTYTKMLRTYQEAVAIGRTYAATKDYQLDGNKEMVALGTMNVIGSMTSCYVATGKHILFTLETDIELVITKANC